MLGRVIDLNNTEAFLTFPDGTTMDIGLAHLPRDVKLGDTVDVNLGSTKMINDKMVDFF